MNVVNETSFTFAPIMGHVVYPKDTLTLIIKGTFRLKADSPAEMLPDDEQLLPTGDQFYDDDPHASVRYESDFVHFKPRADVMVVGHCHVPNGSPQPACSVRLEAGSVAKSLMVFGKRVWERTLVGTKRMTDPEPFTSMPLRYENSFGGPGYSRNPVGKGIRPRNHHESRDEHEIPNLKVLEGEQLATMHEGIPAGFGPLGRAWSQRMALTGTYDKKWQNERWPWLPEDFNWGYFNAAPPDQQIKGYLRGDEPLHLENMHPEHNILRSTLPGIRVRCFLSEKVDGQNRFREVKTHLDTLWADMDKETLLLVWRGLATVSSPECDQVEDLLIVQEDIQEPSKSLDYYAQLLDRRKAEAAAIQAPRQEEPVVEITADPPDKSDIPDAGKVKKSEELETDIQQAMEQSHKSLDHSGLDPKLVAVLKAENDPERYVEKYIHSMGINEAQIQKALAQVRLKQREMLADQLPKMEKQLVKIGIDPSSVMDEYDAMYEEKAADQASSSPSREEMAAAALSAEGAGDQDMSGADFSSMSLEGANFRDAQLEGANFSEACLTGADFSGASLEGANFESADLTDADLTGADLNNAQFTGTRLVQANLAEADLTAARLKATDLTAAVLKRSQLSHADLSLAKLPGADMESADLSGASLVMADMKNVKVDYALFDGANLTQAVLNQARGNNVSLNGSKLTEADFSHAVLEECNFSNCRCDFANFESARLCRSTFEGAIGREVNFRNADLEQLRAGEKVQMPASIFRRARGAKANWAGADLKGSDFILAEMPACDFSQSDMAGCDCRTAEMKQSVFDKACLSKAQFNRSNLFQCRMEKADLTSANFKGSNLYGSEFLNATIDKKTNFKNANIKATKLEP